MKRMQMLGRVIATLSRHMMPGSIALTLLVGPALARNTHSPDVPVPLLTCQNHEPIVWVNTRSGVYHFPGQTWYGRTNDGKYLCKHDADAHGYRATKNGQ